jgi:hypothetical protein
MCGEFAPAPPACHWLIKRCPLPLRKPHAHPPPPTPPPRALHGPRAARAVGSLMDLLRSYLFQGGRAVKAVIPDASDPTRRVVALNPAATSCGCCCIACIDLSQALLPRYAHTLAHACYA